MALSQQHVNGATAMGANLIGGGATFRVWAPAANAVYLCGAFSGWAHDESLRLVRDDAGYWAGYLDGVKDGDQYLYWIDGKGSAGFKRDPWARELTCPDTYSGTLAYPSCNCVVKDPGDYPWHDDGFRAPRFNDLVVYQFHVGTFYGVDAAGADDRTQRVAGFLDVLFRIEHLLALGVNAIEPLPVVEYATRFSLGYNGVDLYAVEMDYAIPAATLARYVDKLNALLGARGVAPVDASRLQSHCNQLKALVDVCHLYGMAVIFDVVYNHAGGGFDDASLYFFDRRPTGSNNDSLFFTDAGWAGGLSFALWKQEVRQFLIDNARFFVDEYHADGLRYDEISTLVALNRNDGWRFCQDLTSSVRALRPAAIQISEHWPVDPYIVSGVEDGGAGFDAAWDDSLRTSIRDALAQASGGAEAMVDIDAIARSLASTNLIPRWKSVQCLENHDLVYQDHGGSARVATLADPANPASWYARSRARVALGLLLAAPGIPMLFMGQELLEASRWSDDAHDNPGTRIGWQRLEQGDKATADYLRYAQELIGVRRRTAALRADAINVFNVDQANRVLAFHRWQPGIGGDVVVVASLNERTFFDYQLGFPCPGAWREVLNSDVYDNWVNPSRAGNGGAIDARGPALHGLPCSAGIVIPANGFLIFARE